MMLEPLPNSALATDGSPCFGAFEGWLARVDLSARLGNGWRAAARRLSSHRRWLGGTFAAGPTLVSFGVADAVYAVHAFAFAADLQGRRRIAGSTWSSLPGAGLSWPDDLALGAGLTCSIGDLRLRLVRSTSPDGWLLSLHSRSMHVEAALSAQGATGLTAVLPARDGDVVVTRRAASLATSGVLTVEGRRRSLDDGSGLVETAEGLFPRRARWRRALASGLSADGARIAFHVADGLSDAPKNEHALWLDGRPSAVGPARFTGDVHHPFKRWQVTTSDGRVNLAFEPSTSHREGRALGLMTGAIDRVAGRYSGTLRTADGRAIRVDSLPGLLELAEAVW